MIKRIFVGRHDGEVIVEIEGSPPLVVTVYLQPEHARGLASELLTAANQAEGHTIEEPS